MKMSTTKTDDREQWRARILRALAELQSDAETIEPPHGHDDQQADGTTNASDV